MGWPAAVSFDVSNTFSASYGQARTKFRDACRNAGLEVTSFRNPAPGPNGQDLTTDVALFGPESAKNIVVVVSGTHGPEGYAGSGCQIGWVREGGPENLPDDVAVLLIHLINPWGTAWGRRQTEDNVDLNRNFLDFTKPLPRNELYSELQSVIHCPVLKGQGRDEARRTIEEFSVTHGPQALAQALFMGQYQDPRGVGYGGNSPTWSNKTFIQILKEYVGAAQTVALIDLHTGYGPYGYGMLLNTDEAESPELQMAREWYGESLIAMKADAGGVPYDVAGDLGAGARKALPDATLVPIAIEYGTYAVDRLLSLQLDDCWLHNHDDPVSPVGRDIRAKLRRFFYPETLDWCQMVHARAQQVIGQAIHGLSSEIRL